MPPKPGRETASFQKGSPMSRKTKARQAVSAAAQQMPREETRVQPEPDAPALEETPKDDGMPKLVKAEKVEKPTPTTTPVGPGTSIRKLITGMLTDGKTTVEITAALKEAFPASQAAAKANKHIAFYKSQLKREQGSAAAKAGE